MRVFANIRALVTEDPDQQQKLVDELLAFDDSDPTTASTYTAKQIVLAPSATGVSFAFDGVTNADTVLIIAQQEITCSLNDPSALTPPHITPVPAVIGGSILSNIQKSPQPGVVLWRGKVTSITLGNPSSTTPATVFILVVGEAL